MKIQYRCLALASALACMSPSVATAADPVPPATWMSKLPYPAIVEAVAHDADPAVSAARQTAALGVLCDYVEGLAGVRGDSGRMPEPAATRWRAYRDRKLQRLAYAPALAEPVRRLSGDLGFRHFILGQLVSLDSIAAYKVTPGYRALVAASPPGAAASAGASASASSECLHTPAGCPWMKELPSMARVLKAYTGPDAPVRQEAAFAVLRDYLDSRTGKSEATDGAGWHPVVWARVLDYLHAVQPNVGLGDLATSGYAPSAAAKALLDDGSFRIDTLSRFVSGDSVAYYESTPSFKQAVARQAEAKRAQAAREARQAANEASAVAGAAEDASRARAAGIDVGVFGIQLGVPMNLPACPEGSGAAAMMAALTGSTVATTCALKQGAGGPLGQLIAQLTIMASSVPWAESALPVQLSRSACPDWVTGGCTVLLDMAPNNTPVGAFFSTRGVEQTRRIVQLLSAKYHGVKVAPGPSLECQNSLTGVVMENTFERHWQMPGLYVSYSPIDTCPNTTIVSTGNAYAATGMASRRDPQGKVTIELAHVRRHRAETGQAREAAEPKL